MPAKVIPCALCQVEAAAIYCVNDDANLCAACDASVHSSNPLLARHERRALSAMACQAECASAACGAPAASTATTDNHAVVPQYHDAEVPQYQPPAQTQPAVAAEPAVAAVPLTLYEDSFFSRSLNANDMLDLDSDELELPGCNSPFSFDPMVDCVVPSFTDDMASPTAADRYSFQVPSFKPQQNAFVPQQSAYMPMPAYNQQHPITPMPVASSMPAPKRIPHQRTAEEEAEDAARVARHRERQRKKRNFGRAVRYQSRRAYAEIRPRIKGRFVSPEEYAQYQAQTAAQKAGLPYVPSMPAPAPVEEDAVVPMPSFVF